MCVRVMRMGYEVCVGGYFYSYETYYIRPKNQLECDVRPEYLDQWSGRLHFVGLSSLKKINQQ